MNVGQFIQVMTDNKWGIVWAFTFILGLCIPTILRYAKRMILNTAHRIVKWFRFPNYDRAIEELLEIRRKGVSLWCEGKMLDMDLYKLELALKDLGVKLDET